MEALRRLPPTDQILAEPTLAATIAEIGRAATTDLVRAVADERRAELLAGAEPDGDRAAESALLATRAARLAATGLRPVVNATGVVVHTNLGRSPLPPGAVAAIARTAAGYADVELDLETGRRGSRQTIVTPVLARLTGAERGLVVNNAAGALVLALAALARGREVIVSRGQMIEIGDGFRLPEIMEQAGARLVEVGSTNRTNADDYRRAIGPDTALLLRAHPSNFRVVGFVEEVTTAELAAIGREHGIPVVDDIGSGLLHPDPDLPGEPDATGSIAAGADLVLFSGDKLLGGPQAGLIVGRDAIVERLARHPLARALRIDRLSLAALEVTLRLHLDRDGIRETVPTRRLIATPVDVVRKRAGRIAEATGGTVVDTVGRIGGGALPAVDLPSAACALPDAEGRLHETLRRGEPAILGRIEDGELLLDCRTLLDEEQVDIVIARVRAALGAG